jgi:hypothetical protein
LHELAGERENRITVREALIKFDSYLDDSNLNSIPRQRSLPFGELGKKVAQQQVAPVQFDIVDAALEFFNNRPR